MIKPFNFFRGFFGARVISIGNVLNELYQEPPFNISRRHWNMLPQDIRGGDELNMLLYIEGWEAAVRSDHNNPYDDMIRALMWNRGWSACWNRRNGRTYTERDMEYYHTDEFVFCDVTEERYNLANDLPYKIMLFRHIENGNTIEGNYIHPNHPMYNFPDII
jgi:hypothetical protein